MPKLIKNGQLLESDCVQFQPFDAVLADTTLLQPDASHCGLVVDNATEVTQLKPYFERVAAIAIEFPLFTDGRGYSLARQLRQAGFKAEIRAVGDVLIDQLFLMQRCGFTAFALRDDQSTEAALAAFCVFSKSYQSAEDDRPPVYRGA